MIADESKRLLIRRKKYLLQKLKKNIIISELEKDNFNLRFLIHDDSGNLIAGAYCKKINQTIHLGILQVGEYKKTPYGIRLKETDPLKGLGIGPLLLNKLIEYSKQKGIKTITLICGKKLVPFYEKFGFKVYDSGLNNFMKLDL